MTRDLAGDIIALKNRCDKQSRQIESLTEALRQQLVFNGAIVRELSALRRRQVIVAVEGGRGKHERSILQRAEEENVRRL